VKSEIDELCTSAPLGQKLVGFAKKELSLEDMVQFIDDQMATFATTQHFTIAVMDATKALCMNRVETMNLCGQGEHEVTLKWGTQEDITFPYTAADFQDGCDSRRFRFVWCGWEDSRDHEPGIVGLVVSSTPVTHPQDVEN
jgi:hypothetical protein